MIITQYRKLLLGLGILSALLCIISIVDPFLFGSYVLESISYFGHDHERSHSETKQGSLESTAGDFAIAAALFICAATWPLKSTDNQ